MPLSFGSARPPLSRHMFVSRKVATYILAVSVFGLVGVWVAWQEMSRGGEPSVPVPVHATQTKSKTVVGNASTVVGPVLSRSKPTRLEIPAIDVDSSVQDLGQQDDGSLEVPTPGARYDEAAWYRYSPTPGSLGPAVLLGHVDSAANGPSVFFRLGELRRRDRITVTRADGSKAVFAVDEIRRFAKDDFPTKMVYGNINYAGLRILTCGGPFDEVSGQYLDNVVVFAHLVEDSTEKTDG